MYSELQLSGGYKQERHPKFCAERLVNFYTLVNPAGKRPSAITTSPGLHTILELESGLSIRAEYRFKNKLYAVSSEYVYEIDENDQPTLLGSIDTSEGYIGIASNDTQVILVDGVKGYIIEASVLTNITDPDFPPKPFDVTVLDTFFIVIQGESNKWFISASDNGKVWDALNYATFTSQPDTLTGIRVLDRAIFVFGKEGVEVWNSNLSLISGSYQGGPVFPFIRQNNMLLNYGCVTAGSIVSGFGFLFWLSFTKYGTSSVMMTNGTRPQRISTPQIDYQIQKYEDISDVRAYMYTENGHLFYVLNFTAADHTWVYDMTTNEWSERETNNNHRHLGQCHAFFNNKHYIGAYNSGKIYDMSTDYYDEDDNNIIRVLIPTHFDSPNYKRISIKAIHIDMVTGEVPANDLGSDPKLEISASLDGGLRYSTIRSVKIGKIGERQKMIVSRNWGIGRMFTFKFRFDSKVICEILGIAISYDVLER